MKFGFTSGLGGSAINANSRVKRPAWERPEARPTRFHWGWGSGCGPGLEPLPASAEAPQPAPPLSAPRLGPVRTPDLYPARPTAPPGAAAPTLLARSARRRPSSARAPNFARPPRGAATRPRPCVHPSVPSPGPARVYLRPRSRRRQCRRPGLPSVHP